MDEDGFEQKIQQFFEEDSLHAKINRTALGLEVRITLDHFMGHTGARLVNKQGREINVHPETEKYYFKLCSLIYEYTSAYGKKPEMEAMKEKWATPARKAYFKND